MLAEQTPAVFRAFDLLAVGDESALDNPFTDRRAALEKLVAGFGKKPGSVQLTPLVGEPGEAEPWLASGEGVIAKRCDSPYLRGERKAMVKVKRLRTIDAVVAGWRPGKEPDTVGSLMLGLYDSAGELRVVGHTSGLKAKEKRELVDTLAPYETGERGSADPSRWSAERDLEWVSLRPELVIEVSFDHVSAGRIRHGAKILRWREDKPPRECSLDQLDS
jgi:ATP-dependent DNA ligase